MSSISRALISAYLKIPVDIGREHMQYTRVRINGYSMFKLVYSKKKNVFFCGYATLLHKSDDMKVFLSCLATFVVSRYNIWNGTLHLSIEKRL